MCRKQHYYRRNENLWRGTYNLRSSLTILSEVSHRQSKRHFVQCHIMCRSGFLQKQIGANFYTFGGTSMNLCKWKEIVHAGNVTYAAGSHTNNKKPRIRNNMNDNCYKKRLTEARNKHFLSEKLEYGLGTVSDKYHWFFKTRFSSAYPYHLMRD